MLRSSDLVKITAILCVTALEALNLVFVGVDSAILVLVVAVISGLAGYEIGKIKIPRVVEEEKGEG